MSASGERDGATEPVGPAEDARADLGDPSVTPEAAGQAVAAVIEQAYRSADWLAAVPLPRLLADDAAVAAEAFGVVLDLDAATRQVAAGGVAGGAAGDLPPECPSPECPPPDAVPPRLAPHAAGAQLRVFADQFARAVAVPGAVGQLDPPALRELATRALALRNRPR